MVKGKTSSGFEFSINPDKFKDARFLMEYARIKSNGDEMGNFLLMEWILGREGYAALCKHCETEEGIAPIETVASEIKEILEAVTESAESKN